MDDTWESNVSPLMLGVGMGDLRGMRDMQASSSATSSCLGGQQDIGRNSMGHHSNMPQHHQDLQHQQQQGGNPNVATHQQRQDLQDLEQDIGRELGGGGADMHQQHHQQQQSQQLHQDAGMGVHDYYANQVGDDLLYTNMSKLPLNSLE
ncbi:hypothetical protein AMK59_2905 [Oryctes borbonicus]|uniref:Uncharacterized protein n=1 Tax=Oryctes borbonicus TaxID=1629725 RepID=A0A0T6BH39_9SCAR|nr:hypothetical protein AMK59_2905 [Oryctes borbonicus]